MIRVICITLGLFLYLPGPIYAETIDLYVIAQIESSGNPGAVGDNGKALGLYQLHEGVIKDYNRARGTSYLHQDALGTKAGLFASWYLNEQIPAYLRHYKLKDSLENRLTSWNAGIGKVRKGYVATRYIRKYKNIKASS